jgi:4-amino-4-deoxychorismate lyase
MIIVNGSAAETIPVMDRGLMYGDGVFRTMRVEHGQVDSWQRQYQKLAADCAALDILCPAQSTLEHDIHEAVTSEPDCVLKIIVSRGEGGRGYGLPSSVHPSRVIVTAPLPEYPARYWEEGVRLHVCEIRMCHQPRLAGIKHLNRLENVLARAEWHDPEVHEGLLCDDTEAVVSGVSSNLFIVRSGGLLTPELGRCGVAGVARGRILRAARAQGMGIEVTRITPAMLLDDEAVMLCNAVQGVRRVARLEDTTWPANGWADRLDAWLNEVD